MDYIFSVETTAGKFVLKPEEIRFTVKLRILFQRSRFHKNYKWLYDYREIEARQETENIKKQVIVSLLVKLDSDLNFWLDMYFYVCMFN